MNWSKLNHSKSQVRKAGRLLRTNILDLDIEQAFNELPEAHRVLSNWRASHAYPMHNIAKSLKTKAVAIDPNAIVVQRLKRTPSIVAKLERAGMELDRMEDIAGCRAVLSDIKSVRLLRDSLVNARFVYALKRERNYIEHPKSSGYRGIHLIFTYQGAKSEYRGLPIELQIRSQIQHSWATAVEVVGTFSKESLKSGEGSQEWLSFFKKVSDGFACLENDEPFPHQKQLKKIFKEMKIEARLKAFTRITDMIGLEKKADYYLLILDIANSKLKGFRASDREWDAIVQKYEAYETEYKRDPTVDVVLVSADSVEELRKGYPNYFADTYLFMNNLKTLLGIKNAI